MQVRFFTLLVFLFGSSQVFAQKDFVDQALSFCKKHGGGYVLGEMYEQGGEYCKQVTCRKASSPGDYTVTDEDVANKNTEGNVEATKTVCVAKSKIDGTFTDGLDINGSTTSGTTNVVIGDGDDLNIYDENGNIIGTRGSGSVSVNVGGSIGSVTMSTGDMCYDKCFRRGFLNIFGKKKWRFDKKSCRKCLESTGRNVSINGSTMNNSSGKVDRTVSLPDGVSISGNGNISGSRNTGNNNSRSVIVSGGTDWSGGINTNGSGHCSYIYSPDECIGTAGNGTLIIQSGSTFSDDCINCEGSWKRRKNDGSVWNGIANLAGAIAGPLAYYGVNAKWANAYQAGQTAWAGAAATGFEQCRLMQTNYVNSTYKYIQNNELEDRTVMPPECNGYQLGGFAGGMGFMGNGFGGFGNPWGAAGYSPGFIAGMYGPYGMHNPYGNGMGFQFGMGMGMGGMPGMGMGMPGYGMGMGMGGMPGMGMGMPGYGMGMGMGGMPGMGMGGMLGMGMGFGLNFGLGMGGGSMANCFTAPCNVGGAGYNYWGSPTNYGMNPWGNGAGSYWNGSGSWGMNGYNNGYANFGNIQQSYMQNQQAAYQDSILSQMGGMNPWSTGYGMGGGMMGNYGYAPYAPSNLGFSMNAGFGFNI